MRIPWQRRKPDDAEQPQPDEAADELEKVKARRPAVESLVADLREIRQRNHLADAIEATMRRRH